MGRWLGQVCQSPLALGRSAGAFGEENACLLPGASICARNGRNALGRLRRL